MKVTPFESSKADAITQTSKELDTARKAEAEAKAQVEAQARAQEKLLQDAEVAHKEQQDAEMSMLETIKQLLKADNDVVELCIVVYDPKSLAAISAQNKLTVEHGNVGSMLRFTPKYSETRAAMNEMVKHFERLQELNAGHNARIINDAKRTKSILDVAKLRPSTFFKLDEAEIVSTPETPTP